MNLSLFTLFSFFTNPEDIQDSLLLLLLRLVAFAFLGHHSRQLTILHLLLLPFLIQFFSYLLQLVHEFFFETFSAGVVVNYVFLENFEPFLEIIDLLVGKFVFGVCLLDFSNEHLEVSS